MTPPRTLQEWIYWLEMGRGARWFRGGAVLLALVLLSLVIAHKQFRGPLNETAFLQADLGRQLAAGAGFTTQVNYPQTAAFLASRGRQHDSAEPFPELSQPPLYSLVVAGLLTLLPADAWLHPPSPPGGVQADYGLLALNLVLLWVAAGQTWMLARRLFDPSAATLAALGLLLSATIWAETVAVNGFPLMMVVLLAVFQAVARADAARLGGRSNLPWLAAAGLAAGLLFLGDYPAGILVPLLAGGMACRESGGRRWRAAGVIVAGALLVAAPWMMRNLDWTGSPVGLAKYDAALRAGDPTAEPAMLRRVLSATAPDFELRKFINKGLSAIQRDVRVSLWSGGMFFSALFVVGWLYRFRHDTVNGLRLIFTVGVAGLVVAQGFFSSGEHPRMAAWYAAPLFMVFGGGFFAVMVASHPGLAAWPRVAGAVLLTLQGLPLLQDVLEPRSIHFNYPPYHPALYQGLSAELSRAPAETTWMADTPAGAAWYGGRRVWAQPSTLREFHEISVNQRLVALVISPHTLDRPFFNELSPSSAASSRFGDWSDVYRSLVTGRLPPSFPLSQSRKIADNFFVLMDPAHRPLTGK